MKTISNVINQLAINYNAIFDFLGQLLLALSTVFPILVPINKRVD